jgi:hypothetical protein
MAVARALRGDTLKLTRPPPFPPPPSAACKGTLGCVTDAHCPTHCHARSYKEHEPILADILKRAGTPANVAHFLRSLPREQQMRWMREVARMPALVVWLLMLPAIRRHERTVLRSMEEVKTGVRASDRQQPQGAWWRLRMGLAAPAVPAAA